MKRINPLTIGSIKLKWLNILIKVIYREWNDGDYYGGYDYEPVDNYAENIVSEVKRCIESMNLEIAQYKFKINKKNLVSQGWSIKHMSKGLYFICPELKDTLIKSVDGLIEGKQYIKIKGLS